MTFSLCAEVAQQVDELTDRTARIGSIEQREAEPSPDGAVLKLDRLHGASLQDLLNGEIGNEADAHPGFDGGDDSLGRIEVNGCAELLPEHAIPLEILLDETPHSRANFAEQDMLVDELGSANEAGLCPAMVGPDDKGDFIFREVFDAQIRTESGSFNQSDRALVSDQGLEDLVGRSAHDMNLEFWPLSDELRQ